MHSPSRRNALAELADCITPFPTSLQVYGFQKGAIMNKNKLAIAQGAAIGTVICIYLIAIFFGPRSGPLGIALSNLYKFWPILAIAACCVLTKNKILQSIGSIIVIYIAIDSIPNWGESISMLRQNNSQESLYGQNYLVGQIENLGWNWLFTIAIISSVSVAAILALFGLDLNSKNFQWPRAAISGIIFATAIISFFWGTSTVDPVRNQKYLFQYDLPVAISALIVGLIFVVFSYSKGIEFWILAITFASGAALKHAATIRYGLSDHYMASWAALLLLSTVVLLSIDEISIEVQDRRFFGPLIKKFQYQDEEPKPL